jgi:hypothetical protein
VVIDYIRRSEALAPAPVSTTSGQGLRRTVGPRLAARGLNPIQADKNIAEAIEGLSSFKDPKDLSYIRGLAVSGAHRGYSQICYSALAAFRQAPDRSNLSIFEEIQRTTIDQTQLIAPLVIVRTWSTHKYRETVPLLVRFLDDQTVAAKLN